LIEARAYEHQQIFLIKKNCTNASRQHEALFLCGTRVYEGTIEVDDSEITLNDLNKLPTILQKQQENLEYKCMSDERCVAIYISRYTHT
jgi:hypothetical protein